MGTYLIICISRAAAESIGHALAPKPAYFLRYWSGPVDRNAGFKTVLVFCVGSKNGSSPLWILQRKPGHGPRESVEHFDLLRVYVAIRLHHFCACR